ncbi:ABC transporter ATP-binding protein [Caenispirillum bisanense]|uniref:ABC transporter ATP-binding protein n=1 Tax=Caenispirillum bisanense TaxID=414052 RepID=UPI0031DA2DF1
MDRMHAAVPTIGGSGPAPAAPTTVLLHMKDLTRTREQADARFELSVPDFRVAAGEFVAVVGASGCGKSTLLDILALVLRPSGAQHFRLAGEAGWIDLADLWRRNDERALAALRRTRLGYVLQTGGLLPFLTVAENIALPARLTGQTLSRPELEAMAADIGIRQVLDKKPQYISGGQRQRAAILRALAHAPGLILADEPTAAVDQERARAIVADFRRAASERGCAVVMVTHDRDLVAPVADRAYTFTLDHPAPTVVRSVCHAGGLA